MNRRLLLPSALLLILMAAFAGLWLWQPADSGDSAGGLPPGGDILLETRDGPFDTRALRGKVVMLYFGYTWCPDVCPTSLALLGMALHKLEPEELEQIQPVFISVDPQRDTLERLAEYTGYFHPAMLGATGSEAQIAAVARQYAVAYAREAGSSSDDYTVDHSSLTYLLDRNGRLDRILQHGTPATQIVEEIRALLAQ